MTQPRLHLVAPGLDPEAIVTCAEAACAAGDVASILIQPSSARALVAPLQRLGLAVLVDGDPQIAVRTGADGVEIAGLDAYREARRVLGPDRIVGASCGASRHSAMELAEAGADYVAFSQASHVDLISWWAEIFEIPCIAADPVSGETLDILLPHKPDFIRPDDAMWTSRDAARDIVQGLTARLFG
ncbi:MAG: thiamine phosphate synthase [Rhizobiales bacterium]|nr:thiamine phosphate synthase [Hyphomicrobiales bacterium]